MDDTAEKVVRITSQAHERLQELAKLEGRTLSAQAKWLIDDAYLTRQNPNPQHGSGNGKST